MCIYYTDQENLTYNSQEHIFPATIGGIGLLPPDYVSDQANNFLSKMELLTFTQSAVAMSKAFEGPGKRGTKNPKGKQHISLMTGLCSGEKILGFIFMGTPKTIPQVRLNIETGEVHYTRNPDDEKGFEKMFNAFEAFKDKYVDLEENNLNDKQVIIGANDKNIFVAHNENFKITIEKLREMFSLFKDNFHSSHLIAVPIIVPNKLNLNLILQNHLNAQKLMQKLQ